MEDLLGVKYVFIESDYTYGTIGTNIRKLVTSGDDAYDLIINDLYEQAALTYEGMYVNINGFENFDLSRTYWYAHYMEDLKIINDRMFIMAGDYFMDVIGSAHALFYNKPMMESIYGDPEAIYEDVIQNAWTLDKMTEYINGAYADLNGDGKINDGDRMGFMCNGTWGSACPFIISADVKFIERDDETGSIEFVFNNERSVKLLEKLNLLFYADGTNTAPEDASTEGLINHFGSEETLILGYNRIGYLEKMRDIEFDIGVVPYPKYDETQEKYVTATHDTTEIGTIPITEKDSEFVSIVIEVSNRETQKYVVPAYYESALKIKYARDETTAMMIDIIHDNFGRTFATAFNNSLNSFGLSTFTTNITNHTNNFESTYSKTVKSATRALEKLVTKTEENTYAS